MDADRIGKRLQEMVSDGRADDWKGYVVSDPYDKSKDGVLILVGYGEVNVYDFSMDGTRGYIDEAERILDKLDARQ